MTFCDISMSDQWHITIEEQAKHEALFMQQNPVNGYLSGDQAKRFFLQSGLPMQTLGRIWALADIDADGRVNCKEFSIAMHLIKRCLHGHELPLSLPPSLRWDPLTHIQRGHFGPGAGGNFSLMVGPQFEDLSLSNLRGFNQPTPFSGMSTFLSPAKLPSNASNTEWTIPDSQRIKYIQLFNSNDSSHKNFLTGMEAKAILSSFGLSQSTLAQIWMLADVDKNGNMTVEEFCVAMHLVDKVLMGHSLPTVLPLDLIPQVHQNSVKHVETLSSTPTARTSVIPSFEQKRKENFEKGQAELERRRAILMEQQKKEAEEQLAFVMREEENKERLRLEQEKRKELELQQRMENLRRQELQEEEQRQKAKELQEIARLNMVRQRQTDWEKQRCDQLNAEKLQVRSSVDKLQQEIEQLRQELHTLECRRVELSDVLNTARQNVVTYTEAIESMRTRRDRVLSEIDKYNAELSEWNDKLAAAESERLQLENHESGTHSCEENAFRSLSNSFTIKKNTVKQLKIQLEELEKHTASGVQQLDRHRQELTSLQNMVSKSEKNSGNMQKSQEIRGNGGTQTLVRDSEDSPINFKVKNDVSNISSDKIEVEQVIALYSYKSMQNDELTFEKDDVISVLNRDDPNWWLGEVRGCTGLFPSNYVAPYSALEARAEMSAPSAVQGLPKLLSETEQKRQQHIKELITTEETYTKDLMTVLEVFYKPLMTEKILTEEELNTMFINWKELRACNMKFMKALRVRQKMCGYGQPIQMIGDLLCENIPHMTPYIRFCSCQLNSAALLQKKSESDAKFKEIHKKCCQNARTMGMPLSSFLLKPMQRITRYPLLIDKILQHTPSDHPDHHNIQEALSKATELCSQVNEGVREKEHSDRLEWLQNHVHCDGLPEKLTFNSSTNCLGPRKYIYGGTLYKLKSGKELVGFLFNDILLLTQPQRPIGSISSIFHFDLKHNGHFKMYRNPIFLNEVMLRKLPDDDPESGVFHLSHVDHLYSLRAPSTVERDMWVQKIEAASKYYLETERKKREKAHHERRSKTVGRLLVVIVEGANLCTGEDGKSDPYCEVSMGAQEHKTKVIPNSLNPKWNASMQFTIKDLNEDVLCITVYDRDFFSPNDFLGRTEMRVKDILTEMRKAKGTVTKRLLLHEVDTGEIVVKLNLQLFSV